MSPDTGSKSLIPNQKFLHISAMAKGFSLWMVGKLGTWQQCIADGKLCRTGKESNYTYIGVSSDRDQAVEYAKQHMAKDQLGDDWQDHCVMIQIQFSAKGVSLYCTTLADDVLPPTPMLRKLCHKDLKNDEGKWHLCVDVPLKQTHDGERIVTILWDNLTTEEKEKLGKKVPESSSKRPRVADSPIEESPSKRPRVADSPKKCKEVEVEEQDWKRQKKGPLQDPEKKSFVLYKVVETEWVETHYHLLQKNPQDDDGQSNPEHEEFKERYKAFREKHRLDLEEEKPFVQVCQHGYERQRGHWSIELFECKRRAIELTALRMKRRVLEPQSYRLLAVLFSTEALAKALTQCEKETPKFKTQLLRGHNTDIDLDKQTWYWNGDTLPLFQRDNNFNPQVSAWSESVTM